MTNKEIYEMAFNKIDLETRKAQHFLASNAKYFNYDTTLDIIYDIAKRAQDLIEANNKLRKEEKDFIENY